MLSYQTYNKTAIIHRLSVALNTIPISALTYNQIIVSGQGSGVSGQHSGVSGQRSGVSGQRSAVRGQRSGVSGQRSAVSGQPLAECK
ncbi:MAG: hypothetical protein F6K26_46695 [Moorea sp. SIO2I5]|nr:hypothetical protein [Moorena sp. SIO2I5]